MIDQYISTRAGYRVPGYSHRACPLEVAVALGYSSGTGAGAGMCTICVQYSTVPAVGTVLPSTGYCTLNSEPELEHRTHIFTFYIIHFYYRTKKSLMVLV